MYAHVTSGPVFPHEQAQVFFFWGGGVRQRPFLTIDMHSTRHPQPPATPHHSGRDPERGTAGPHLDCRAVPVYMVNPSR